MDLVEPNRVRNRVSRDPFCDPFLVECLIEGLRWFSQRLLRLATMHEHWIAVPDARTVCGPRTYVPMPTTPDTSEVTAQAPVQEKPATTGSFLRSISIERLISLLLAGGVAFGMMQVAISSMEKRLDSHEGSFGHDGLVQHVNTGFADLRVEVAELRGEFSATIPQLQRDIDWIKEYLMAQDGK